MRYSIRAVLADASLFRKSFSGAMEAMRDMGPAGKATSAIVEQRTAETSRSSATWQQASRMSRLAEKSLTIEMTGSTRGTKSWDS